MGRRSMWHRMEYFSVVDNYLMVGEKFVSVVVEAVVDIVYVNEVFGVFALRYVFRDCTVVVTVYICRRMFCQSCP